MIVHGLSLSQALSGVLRATSNQSSKKSSEVLKIKINRKVSIVVLLWRPQALIIYEATEFIIKEFKTFINEIEP